MIALKVTTKLRNTRAMWLAPKQQIKNVTFILYGEPGLRAHGRVVSGHMPSGNVIASTPSLAKLKDTVRDRPSWPRGVR